MKRELKQAVKNAFEAPSPQKKEAFLQEISRLEDIKQSRKITNLQFVGMQFFYIRKWVWAVSLLTFVIALFGGCVMQKNVLWVLSAMMPFLALTVVTETIRSETCGMAELEMASRFSLKSIVLARMGILGLVHLTLLLFLAFIASQSSAANGATTTLKMGVYLLVPYLLTDAGGLWLVRKIRGREAVYACFGLAVLIGMLPVLGCYVLGISHQIVKFGWWVATLLVLCFALASEFRKNMKRTEEFTWNLS